MARFDFARDAELQPEDDHPRPHGPPCDTTVHDVSSMTRADAGGQVRLDADFAPILAPPADRGAGGWPPAG